jgi:trehalose/maltose hydrolase-like predicted phosphorylase
MSISRLLATITQFLTEAAMEIFAPNHDSYPNIGIQPFTGEAYKGHADNW